MASDLVERLIRLKDVTSEQAIRDLLSDACNALSKHPPTVDETIGKLRFEAMNTLNSDKLRFAILTTVNMIDPRVIVDPEPVAVAHSFDGYGWQYIDNGFSSQWLGRGMNYPDHVLLYRKAE